MESPLLNGPRTAGGDGDYLPVKSLKEGRRVFWRETVKTWRIAGPIIFQIICQYGINAVTTIFVGHLGEVELAAVTIGLSVVSTFAFGFLYGMGSATETLCGQAYGAGQIHMLGVYMQRSWIIMLACCCLMLPIYIFATPILILLGQEEDIAIVAGKVTRLIIPQLFSFAIGFPTQKFLQAQRKVGVLAWIGFSGLMLQILLLWLFIDEFDWGITGATVSLNISSWGICIAQIIYALGWNKDAWNGFTWLAFKEIWAFVRLSLASAVMLCLEVWYIVSLVVLAGGLSDAVISVDALSICSNVNGWEIILFIGVNAGISVRVSNELGMGHPRVAKYAVYVTVFESLLLGLIFMVLIIIVRDDFAVIYTDSEDVQRAVAELAYLLGITMVLNSVQPVISGVAVGAGWQALVAYINLGCYYAFGLPLGYLLGYVANLGVMGLWGGMIAGTLLQTVLLIIVLYKTNWNREVEKTMERMRKWGGQDINTLKVADESI